MKLKKLLILSLGFALSLDAFAQQRVAKNDIKPLIVEIKKGIAIGNEGSVPTASNFAPQTAESVVINRYQDLEDAETMMTYYDLQSNRWCSNRMYQLPNGNVALLYEDESYSAGNGFAINYVTITKEQILDWYQKNGGIVTDIDEEIHHETIADDAVYDLQGRRMTQSSQLPKGIYVQQGRKFVVK